MISKAQMFKWALIALMKTLALAFACCINVSMPHCPVDCATLHPTKIARQRVWGWLRKELCRRDLEDFPYEKPAISKVAYRARVRTVLRAQKAQRVAT